MTTSPDILTSSGWFGKSSAGLLLGFTLALGLSSLFALLAGVDNSYLGATGQIAMWLMAPIWSGVLAFCFLFRSGARAWGWLGLANLIAWTGYVVARLIIG